MGQGDAENIYYIPLHHLIMGEMASGQRGRIGRIELISTEVSIKDLQLFKYNLYYI